MLTRIRSSLQRAGLLETAVLATFLLIGISVWVFIKTAGEVLEGGTKDFDEWLITAMRRNGTALPVGPPWLLHAALDLTALGSPAVVSVITAGTAGFLALRRKWGAMWLVTVSVAGGGVVSSVAKSFFDRPRPDISLHLQAVTSQSFPSGHSLLAAATYFTLGALLAKTTSDRRIKVYFLALAVLLATLVGITRVYLGVHFPTDVLGGWCAGIAWALICSLVARWLQREGTIENEAPVSLRD